VLVLGALYVAEGLPFGFQSKALPLYLREQGVSLAVIPLAGLLTLPWWLKFLWAPLVDRYGTRRTWMAPCMLGLAATAAVASLLPLDGGFAPFFALIALQNVFAATMDIAVDGLAIDLLGDGELGPGNAAQVGGYKVGMLLSGALLVWISETLGLGAQLVFAGTAVVTLAVLVVVLLLEEPPPRRGAGGARTSMRGIVNAVVDAARTPGTVWLLAVVLTYKLGESMVDVMFKPFLSDRGYDIARVALWMGTPGMIVSILGSIVGGWLVMRLSVARALRITAVARVFPLLALAAVAALGSGWSALVAVTMAEEFFGGALTTATFALMMSRVDPRIGATHFTALACVELAGKATGGLPSGLIAGWLGFTAVFAGGAVLSIGFAALAFTATRSPSPAPAR
jgi:MFS family permease